ncbi:hypothetical protein M514_08048, partial [Trichuris suis]
VQIRGRQACQEVVSKSQRRRGQFRTRAASAWWHHFCIRTKRPLQNDQHQKKFAEAAPSKIAQSV